MKIYIKENQKQRYKSLNIADGQQEPDWLKNADIEDAVVEIDINGNVIWRNGVWKSGGWLGDIWSDGIWHTGEWYNGAWYNGKWYDGERYNGKWYDGEWFDGIWYNGLWVSGTWHGGIWEKGRIYNLDDGAFYEVNNYTIKDKFGVI